jgi:transcriptional regulator with XRE-family HTH domain
MKAISAKLPKLKVAKVRGIPNLRSLRQKQGLSLGQLADLSGLRKDTITHLEAGREEPQPSHVRILARVLGVATLDLVS